MKFYLDSILKGFRPDNSQVVLDNATRQTPNFVVVDIDQDGMPEILFAYQFDGERYIAILKRENTQWYVTSVSLEKDKKAVGLANLVSILDNIALTQEDVGKVVTMNGLLGGEDQPFLSFIDDMLNHGMVVQNVPTQNELNMANVEPTQESVQGNLMVEETGATSQQILQQNGSVLPPSQNVKTPIAQKALNQPFITPIMSTTTPGQTNKPGQMNNQGQMNMSGQSNNQGQMNKPGQMNNQGQMNMSGQSNIPGQMNMSGQMNAPGQMNNQGQMNMSGQSNIPGQMNKPGQTNIPGKMNMSGQMNAPVQSLTSQQILEQTGSVLPPHQNINTPAAQQALNQNVTTPIMSATNLGFNQGIETGEQIIQQTGPTLPMPENINTPAAQQALNQNVITPIMSVTETDQAVNATPAPNESDEYEEPVVTTSTIKGTGNLASNIGLGPNQEVIDFIQADVTGDGSLDSIYLVGDRSRRPYIPNYVENVGLRVVSGNRLYEVTFPYGNGYSPALFVGDLTRDGIDDVLVNLFPGIEGSFLTSYSYTFANDMPKLLSDSKVFNDIQTGTVIYKDNYKVDITTHRPPRVFTIDISDRDPSYLAELYNPDGTLRRPVEGTLLGLASLHPVDFDFSGQYNLSAVQRVIGVDNLDTLGLVETYFTWDPTTDRFEPFAQYFSILGRGN